MKVERRELHCFTIEASREEATLIMWELWHLYSETKDQKILDMQSALFRELNANGEIIAKA